MSMRISSAGLVCLLLAACSGGDAADATAVEAGDQMLACAIGPGSTFSDSCSLQKFVRDGETIYRVNQPGGGFRLFNLAKDGGGMVPHDGAEGAVNTLDGGVLEVTVGDDRYRFPAKADAN
jgi:hypothetical protein